jgi:hypothetical protein
LYGYTGATANGTGASFVMEIKFVEFSSGIMYIIQWSDKGKWGGTCEG